jgi:eukaryotic-like serine/threonine-protein kinase
VIGTNLGPYRVLEKLGAGAMGEVYVALDAKLDRRVAIKVLPGEMARDEGLRARFVREAKALAALSHPNILAIHDFGDAAGVSYAVTELLEGETLAACLRAGPLSATKAIDWALQIARGLAAAHDKGIVHRDLKPANIFVTGHGGVKILDFGLAKVAMPFAGGGETGVMETMQGTVLGTLAYMSPEQARGRDTDHRTDLFALGAVLYEMLEGRPAFAADSGADTLSQILKHEPTLTRPDGVSTGLRRIVTRALEKDPRERFQSARDLVFALEALSGFDRASGDQPADRRTRSIAVLPFTDMSPGKDQAYFCEGMAEEIINALTGVAGLRVAARSSAFRFKAGERDLREIGRALDVSLILEGSVRTAGNRLRVTAQLNEVHSGYQVWSRRYDRALDDVFATQDEIAADLVQALQPDLGSAAAPLVVRHTENQEAYHLYLKGRHHWSARSPGALQKALRYFEEATEKDPDYALPYVGLADLYTVQGLYYYVPPSIVRPRARAAIRRALAINDQLSDAHRALGFTQLFDEWDLRTALRSFERSIELDPTSALSHIWLGWSWSAWPGREQAAIAAARRAQTLDPLNPYINGLLGAILDFWGHGAAGVEEGQKALELDPNNLVALYLSAAIFTRLGRHDAALPLFSRALEISERAPFIVGYQAWALATAGRSDEARSALAELEAREATEPVSPLHKAIVYAALGQLDRAFDLLSDSVRVADGWLSTPRMPMFDGFRGDARFAEHLRRIGHPDAPGLRPGTP